MWEWGCPKTPDTSQKLYNILINKDKMKTSILVSAYLLTKLLFLTALLVRLETRRLTGRQIRP